jgi:hypothetical protein
MDVERRLVGPEFKQDQRVRVEGALKDLKLLATRFLLDSPTAVGHGLGECGTLSGLGVHGNDETYGHGPILS